MLFFSSIGVVTNVFNKNKTFFVFGFKVAWTLMLSGDILPKDKVIRLPVKQTNSLSPLTATPIRSQSGSLPITASAFDFFPSSIALESASLFSGLGDSTELKFESNVF